MDFKNYYERVQKIFKFRIKTLHRLDDVSMSIVEDVLEKYRPDKISKPKKMMFQTNPLGFVGVKNVELYYFDVELTVPASPAILQNDLLTSFGLSPDSEAIQVFQDGSDPMAGQEERVAMEKEAEKNDSLLNQPDYPEAAPVDSTELFGDAYNKKFLDYVKDVEKQRDLNKKIDAPHPITKWSKQPDPTTGENNQDKTNFNADLKTQPPVKFETRPALRKPTNDKAKK